MFTNKYFRLGKLVDNARCDHPVDVRRTKSDIVVSVESGQRMLEHRQFQRSHGNNGRTQVIISIDIQLCLRILCEINAHCLSSKY